SVDRNKRYTGFLPLRDYDYLGMWTKPLVFMNAGVVPRPAGFSINDLETYNDADTVTNLILLGIGATWYPWKDEHKGSVSVNAFSHWEASQHYKWDTTKTQPSSIVSTLAADGTTSGRRTWSGWYDKTQEAGQHLGYEFSAIFDCEVNKRVSFTSCAGVFFPGQLYRDLSGQPNANTGYWGKKIEDSGSGVMSIVNVDEDAGLGQSISYGAYARVSYEF
ncbi:hypothetical protein HOD08_01680, partial [bacterium]|nr:hypothetical protein [bacterium]